MTGLNLNLLPSQARFQAAKVKLQKKVRLVMVAMVGIWVLVVGAVFAINIISKLRINVVQAQYDKARKDYMSMSDDIVTSQRLKYKAKLVGGVLSNRFEYGKAFGMITNLFPVGIKMNNFDLEKEGVFNIKGETSGQVNVDTLESIITDINAGRNDKFSSAKLLTIAMSDGVWSFEMEVIMR